MQHLQPNTTLQGGKYRIERVLGQGGFGNTYIGYNTEFEETVAIKEFFMKGVAERNETTSVVSVSNADNVRQFEEQKEKFKKEARRLRKLKNEHIVKVHDLFEENGTAYYVMDYVDGENLSDRLKRTEKSMTEDEVNQILPQILDALKTIHNAGFWHLDLKPANIMVDKSGNVKLIDFGASKQLNTQKGGATTSTAISYTNGYAPREQMEQNYDKFGPWTDIYALGATLYTLLTNRRPPLPSDIDDDMSKDKHLALPMPMSISTELHNLILWLISTNRNQRPQNVEEITINYRKRNIENEQTELLIGNKDIEETDEETIVADLESEEEEKRLLDIFGRGKIILGIYFGIIVFLLLFFGLNKIYDMEQQMVIRTQEVNTFSTEIAQSMRETIDAKLEAVEEEKKAAEKAKSEEAEKKKKVAEKAKIEAGQQTQKSSNEILQLRENVIYGLTKARDTKKGIDRRETITSVVNTLNTLCTKDPRNKKAYLDIKDKLNSNISYSNTDKATSHYNILIKYFSKIR